MPYGNPYEGLSAGIRRAGDIILAAKERTNRAKKEKEEELKRQQRANNLADHARTYGKKVTGNPQYKPDEIVMQAITTDAATMDAGDVRRLIDNRVAQEKAKAAEAQSAKGVEHLLEQPASVQASMETRTGGMSPTERNVNIQTLQSGSPPQQYEVIDRMKLPVPEKPDEKLAAREAAAANIQDPVLRNLYLTGQITEAEAGVLPEQPEAGPTKAHLQTILNAVRSEAVDVPFTNKFGLQEIRKEPAFPTPEAQTEEAVRRYLQSEEVLDQLTKDYSNEIEAERDLIKELQQQIQNLYKQMGQ